jgi:putative exporter of polyketide antibiotics
MRVRADGIFSLFLLAVVSVFLIIAIGYPIRAAFGPLATGIPAAILLITQFVLNIRKKTVEGTGQYRHSVDEPSRRNYFNAIGWIIGLLGVTYLIGILITFPLFTLCYIKLNRWGWFLSIGLALGVFILLYGVFGYILQVPLYEGILFQ